MDRIDRAKQFLPFDAMKGLKEALEKKEKEKMRTEKRELSEEDAEDLSRRLSKLERGMGISVLFYKNGYYLEKRGKIEEFNAVYRYMKLGGERIFFDDIYKLGFIE